MVGIIDPLRAEAKGAVETARRGRHRRPHDHRDHAVTAQAISEALGLGPGAISGTELRRCPTRNWPAGSPRCTSSGASPRSASPPRPAHAGAGADRRDNEDAVNDAVRPQAGRHRGGDRQRQRGHQTGGPDRPHDDNFGTLVRAVEISRRVYRKVTLASPLPNRSLPVPGAALYHRDRVRHQPGVALTPRWCSTCSSSSRPPVSSSSPPTPAEPTSCTARLGTREFRSPTAQRLPSGDLRRDISWPR